MKPAERIDNREGVVLEEFDNGVHLRAIWLDDGSVALLHWPVDGTGTGLRLSPTAQAALTAELRRREGGPPCPSHCSLPDTGDVAVCPCDPGDCQRCDGLRRRAGGEAGAVDEPPPCNCDEHPNGGCQRTAWFEARKAGK